MAEVTPCSALMGWGGFFFERDGDALRVVDDERLPRGRRESIGARSQPYGKARVEVFDHSGALVASAETSDRNHVWVEGLEPDSEYTYRVSVDGRPWADGPRRDWSAEADSLVPGGRYDNTFRTHPAPNQAAPVSLAVIGDYGVGIRGNSETARRQRRLANALEQLTRHEALRCLVTTGDNIYHRAEGDEHQGSGDEDDDWFFTFYQPLRYLINRIPVYPCVGNHDSSDTDKSDDREQLEDNFLVDERFRAQVGSGRASVSPGLFYRVRIGQHLELVCLDTSLADELPDRHYFTRPEHQGFLDAAFPSGGDDTTWRIPFSHHPAFCAGPKHGNTEPMLRHLVPRFERAGVRAVLAGHEHNFQYSEQRDVHYFLTGGGGKLRAERPTHFAEANTVAWGARGHLLLLRCNESRLEVTPVRSWEHGVITELVPTRPDGRALPVPIVIDAR